MLQVICTGLQDRERLNAPCGQPTVKFYKSVMRRRTRWASQWRRVEFDNLADFGKTAITTIPINGELITRATLVVELPDIYSPQIKAINASPKPIVGPSWAWTNGIGHAICSDAQFLINDQIIDQFDSQLLEVIDEQERPVEHFDSTDTLIARDPSTFTDQQTIQLVKPLVSVQPPTNPPTYVTSPIKQPQTNPQTVEVIFPFWWNRGPGPQALPIQALSRDKVQIKTTFRAAQDLVYTSTRINPANPALSANQGAGPLPSINGCGFFVSDISSSTLIYNAASTANLQDAGLSDPFPGSVYSDKTMPTDYHFIDAYWIIEYVSLEDREAAAFRTADLEIPIEQHLPLPIITTGGSPTVGIRMGIGGLVRDLTWVAQRVEASSYNAYFLFSKDLAPTGFASTGSPCDVPWWPNALIPNWDYGTGYLRPGFSDRGSDPIVAAKMTIRGLTRFEHEGVSIFRSLLPALGCKRTPLIDRYIYRYDFGFWPTGGLAEALFKAQDEIRGCANWDKLPRRELTLTMNQASCGGFSWVTDTSQPIQTITGSAFVDIDALFDPLTDGLYVTLRGAQPLLPDGSVDVAGNNGNGAVVAGYIDMTALRRQPGYIHLRGRTNENGSASLVQRTTAKGYEWIAVAASGGYGIFAAGGGGYAGSAVEVGWRGGNTDQAHDTTTSTAGSIAYNTLGKTNITATNILFDNSANGFLMQAAGTFVSVQMSFGIAADTTVAPIVITMTNVTQGLTYTLKSPTSHVYVPVKRWTIKLPTTAAPVHVASGDTVYFTITTQPTYVLPKAFDARVETNNNFSLACKLIIQQDPNTVVVPRTYYGGGGGGRLTAAGVGLSDGVRMTTLPSFVESHQQTGGQLFNFHGGDGYYGGGSGSVSGGGGGSYVSALITQVDTYEGIDSPLPSPVSITLVPQKRVPTVQPSYNIHAWVTRYNRLRINSGHGALLFSEAT